MHTHARTCGSYGSIKTWRERPALTQLRTHPYIRTKTDIHTEPHKAVKAYVFTHTQRERAREGRKGLWEREIKRKTKKAADTQRDGRRNGSCDL